MKKISNAEIEQHLRLGEDSSWEFKQIEFSGNRPKNPSRDKLADEIAAFANAEGGVLLCGVTDSGEVQGMTRKQMDKFERLISELCADSINPPLYVVICRREIEKGKPFLLVQIPPGNALHVSPGGSYWRVGSSTRRMNTDEQLRLAQRRTQARFFWFDKQHVPDTGLGTLEESLWQPLLSTEGSTDIKAALQKLCLLVADQAGDLRATVTGVLFCMQNPHELLPQAVITATCYEGTDRASNQLDAKSISGPLNRQIVDAVQFVRRNMKVASHKTPARDDMPQYSLRAIFEAVVNAVVHRDYAINQRKIRLSIFNNRLEIISPGGLPNGMTIDAMSETQATRNEAIASIFRRLPVTDIHGTDERKFFMEQRGDGVRIILRKTQELSGKEPEYRILDGKDICLTMPAALHRVNPNSVSVRVFANGAPVPGVDILVLYPNKTYLQAITDYNGEVLVDLYTTELPMKVLCDCHRISCSPRTELDTVK